MILHPSLRSHPMYALSGTPGGRDGHYRNAEVFPDVGLLFGVWAASKEAECPAVVDKLFTQRILVRFGVEDNASDAPVDGRPGITGIIDLTVIEDKPIRLVPVFLHQLLTESECHHPGCGPAEGG